jgi:hypothetical protein
MDRQARHPRSLLAALLRAERRFARCKGDPDTVILNAYAWKVGKCREALTAWIWTNAAEVEGRRHLAKIGQYGQLNLVREKAAWAHRRRSTSYSRRRSA